jgi:hypothetical protein
MDLELPGSGQAARLQESWTPASVEVDDAAQEISTSSASSSSAQPPGQLSISAQRLGANKLSEADLEKASSTTPAGNSAENDRVELVSGPHLRAVVGAACFVLWLAVRLWEGHMQLYLLPVLLLCTASTSALWCTPTELAVSLGPVPVCFFRRRINYKEIASVTIVRGRLQQFAKLAWQGATRPWQLHGFVYGLTIGKDLIDISLQRTEDSLPPSRLWPKRLLVSVDEAEGIVAHVLFRQKHGSQVPVLTPQPRHPIMGPVRWVLCDACDVLVQPWRTYEPMAIFRDGGGHQRTA